MIKISLVRRGRSAVVFVTAISLLAIATDALAQFGGRMPDSGRGGRGPGGDARTAAPRSMDQESRVDLFEATLHELREDLKLTPAQQGAWDAYEGKVRALAADLKRERNRRLQQPEEQKTALQRIDQMVDVARNRLAALEEIADAAKALYASLTPEQRAIADARLASAIPTANESMARGMPSGPGELRRGPSGGRPRDPAP